MMRTTVKKAISLFLAIEALIGVSYFYDFSLFINSEVAFLSSFFVIVGSSFAYKKMVTTQVEKKEYEELRDPLEKIEDPYELYDDKINNAPLEELDIKEIVKEEKAKIKTFNTTAMKQGVKGGFSPFRLVPYLFLIVGFIALENNHYLDLKVYLPMLLVGIVAGNIVVTKITK